MTQHEKKSRTHLDISGNTLQIFSQLEMKLQGAKDEENRNIVANKIVSFACEENYDCVAILQAAKIGYSALATHGNYDLQLTGSKILGGINDYFRKRKVTTKLIYAENISLGVGFKQVEQVTHEAQTLKAKALSLPSVQMLPGLDHNTLVLDRILANLETLAKRKKSLAVIPGNLNLSEADIENSLYPMPLPISSLNRHDESFDRALEVYKEILKLSSNTASLLTHDRFHTAEKLVELGSTADRAVHPDIPDILSAKFSGTTLGEILLGDSNIDSAANQTINFISSLPSGDYFWQKVANSIFLVSTQSEEIESANEFYTNPQLAKRIFGIQKFIAEKILIPVFGENPYIDPQFTTFQYDHGFLLKPDSDFDAMVVSLLQNLDQGNLRALGELIYRVGVQGCERDQLFESANSENIISENLFLKWPFLILAFSDAVNSRALNNIHGVDLYAHSFFQKNWEIIQASLKRRYSLAGHKLLPVLKPLKSWVEIDYVTKITDIFISALKNKLGNKFREIAEEQEEDIESITKNIWGRIQRIDNWPEPFSTLEIKFVQDDLPAIMGFDHIEFRMGKDRNDPLHFRLNVSRPTINIIGSIGPDGKMTYLVLDFSSKYPKLTHLIEQIAVGWLHDSLEAYSISSKANLPKTMRTSPVFDIDESEDDTAAEISGEPTPRKKYVRRSDSERIRSVIEKERGPGKTQFRPMRPVKLFGVSEYEQACRKYREEVTYDDGRPINIELETHLRANIEFYRDHRRNMNQPSEYKMETFEKRVQKLPERFQLELTDPDPITGEKFYRQTWRRSHTIPPLTKAELRGAAKRFEVDGGGPISGFINSHVIWIIYDILENEDD